MSEKTGNDYLKSQGVDAPDGMTDLQQGMYFVAVKALQMVADMDSISQAKHCSPAKKVKAYQMGLSVLRGTLEAVAETVSGAAPNLSWAHEKDAADFRRDLKLI